MAESIAPIALSEDRLEVMLAAALRPILQKLESMGQDIDYLRSDVAVPLLVLRGARESHPGVSSDELTDVVCV